MSRNYVAGNNYKINVYTSKEEIKHSIIKKGKVNRITLQTTPGLIKQ